ncbi:hypothetical protein AAC387_Pa10g1420 [Persea americana]
MNPKNKKDNSKRSVIPWSDLPEILLYLVCSHLRFGDFLSFQRVCSTWRAAAKQLGHCLNSPLLMLPSLGEGFHHLKCPLDRRWYMLTVPPDFSLTYQCLGSFHGWLLMVHAVTRDIIFLFNPFTSTRIDLPQWGGTIIYKATLSSAPKDPNCTVIILDESHWSFSFCRIGDVEWTRRDSDSTFLTDALMFRGKFYLLCSQKPATNTIPLLNVEYLELPHQPYSDAVIDNVSHLVESAGELLLVVKRYDLPDILPFDFMVFKLDPSTSLWIETKKIGNRVLFLGRSSASFNATELRCKENQIYFLEPLYDYTTWWAFNMEDGRIKCFAFNAGLIRRAIPGNDPLWITPSFV